MAAQYVGTGPAYVFWLLTR